jgi:hypothetical protein
MMQGIIGGSEDAGCLRRLGVLECLFGAGKGDVSARASGEDGIDIVAPATFQSQNVSRPSLITSLQR